MTFGPRFKTSAKDRLEAFERKMIVKLEDCKSDDLINFKGRILESEKYYKGILEEIRRFKAIDWMGVEGYWPSPELERKAEIALENASNRIIELDKYIARISVKYHEIKDLLGVYSDNWVKYGQLDAKKRGEILSRCIELDDIIYHENPEDAYDTFR